MTSAFVVNGWQVYAHPLFLDQVEELVRQTERAKQSDPATYQGRRCTRLLAAIAKLAFHDIPENPARDLYRLGDTMGSEYTHWRRAKFYQQYRLFFRYRAVERIIVYAWVNDDDTRRAYGSRTDAYAVFRRMLAGGNPPDNWDRLKAACDQEADARLRLTVSSTSALPPPKKT